MELLTYPSYLFREVVTLLEPEMLFAVAPISRVWASEMGDRKLWEKLTLQRWPTLVPHLRSHVVFGNWKQLYRARALALAPVNAFEDYEDPPSPPLEQFIFTLEFWGLCDGKDAKQPKKRPRGNLYGPPPGQRKRLVRELSFPLDPDEAGLSTLNLTIPIKYESEDLSMTGSIYQAATGATARLRFENIGREDVWWLHDAEELGEELPANHWRDVVSLQNDTETDMPEDLELFVIMYGPEENGGSGTLAAGAAGAAGTGGAETAGGGIGGIAAAAGTTTSTTMPAITMTAMAGALNPAFAATFAEINAHNASLGPAAHAAANAAAVALGIATYTVVDTADANTGAAASPPALSSVSPLAQRLAAMSMAQLKAEAARLGIEGSSVSMQGSKSLKATWVKAIRTHHGEESALRLQITVERSSAWGSDQQEGADLAKSMAEIFRHRV